MLWSSAAQRGCVAVLRRCSLAFRPRTVIRLRGAVDTSRTFFLSTSKGQTPDESIAPLKRWVLAVSPFSTVRTQLDCSISIGPLDPHAFPEADRAFVTVRGADTGLDVGVDHVRVRYDEHRSELNICAEKVNSCVSIDVAAPIKSSE